MPCDDQGVIMFGWHLKDTPIDPAHLQRLADALGEGWGIWSHGAPPSLPALTVLLGVEVAVADPDPMAAGFDELEHGEDDDTLLDGLAVTSATITSARKALRARAEAVLAQLAELGAGVYDADSPQLYLLVTGGSTRALVIDAKGRTTRVGGAGNPARLRLARGTSHLIVT